ncbi:unnamed protein product [Pylaiella littoralis]
MTVIGTSASFGSDESKVDLDGMAELRQVGGRLSPDSWHIDAVLPPDASEMVYEDLQPVAAAMQECEVLQEGNGVSVFDDEELGVQVVELLGRRCCVTLPCSSILRHLCLHMKALDKFFSFEVEIVDDTKRYRYIEISNTRSVADIGTDRALLPLRLEEGWQRVNIDLDRTVRLAFGSSYLTTSQVTIRASARVAKVFFQSQEFSDFELPSHLRVVAER